jgi:Glycosyl transferase family 2
MGCLHTGSRYAWETPQTRQAVDGCLGGFMWNGRSVSVVLMTYAERDSIRSVIDAFFATKVVDEVIVVDNNAQAGTREQVAMTDALCVREERQGYGFATRRGLAEASGELIVLAEPDGTFLASDIVKLLAYSDECDAVFGSRTNRALIWHGANMGPLLSWGNWTVAKMARLLFNSVHLSDVGCTYRLFTRAAVDTVLPQLRIGGSQLGPELMLRTITSGLRFVEVPVNYLPRVGVSSVTGDIRKAIWLGLQMSLLILSLRVRTWRGSARAATLRLPVPAAPDLAGAESGSQGHAQRWLFSLAPRHHDQQLYQIQPIGADEG